MSKTMEKGTENAIFLDGRDYTAADLYRLIGLLVGNGVYTNELATTATNDDMSITHGAGHAWIGGVLYWNTTPFTMGIATADGVLNRYDSVMVRRNLSINETYAIIVQGEYAANPTPPACVRNAEIFDLKTCDIYVPAGCTKITQDLITDTRLDASVCGVPVFPVEHMDMTSFYRQITADLANFRKKNEADFTAWVEDQQESNMALMAALVETVRNTSDSSREEILELLAQLNGLVAGDTVGELIAQINEKLPKSGGTMTGNLSIPAPSEAAHAVNKGYVDTIAVQSVLTAAGWFGDSAPYTQTIQVEGLTDDRRASGHPEYGDDKDANLAMRDACACVSYAKRDGSSMTFVCLEDKPAVDISVTVEVYI